MTHDHRFSGRALRAPRTSDKAGSSSARSSRFRRDRMPAGIGIKLRKFSIQRCKHLIHKRADRPQRMISRYPPLYRDVAEESIRSIIFAAHGNPHSKGITHMHRITLQPPRKTTFSAAC
jgi:hypothetical protein